MKKLATLLITLLLVIVSCFALSACGNDFKATSMTDWGDVMNGQTGSFYAETKNYIYYINGVGTLTDDNEFGVPVKGALMCVEKSSIGNASAKTEIVVPKIFVGNDTDAGIYLFGSDKETYVYYATPNVNKDSSGKIANKEVTFMRTRLDSNESEELFSVGSLDTQYRMAEKNGVVYIVYFDDANSQLKVFDTKSKSSSVIISIDEKINNETVIDERTLYLSLDVYKMMPSSCDYQVVYSVKAYTEKYYEEKASKEGYARETAKYNFVYAYSVKDGKKVLLNGTNDSLTYTFDDVKDGYLFYTATDIYSKAKNYAVSVEGDVVDNTKTKLNGIAVTDKVYFVSSLDKVYVFDSDKQNVYTLSLTTDDLFNNKEIVLSADNVSSILKIENNTVYYITTEKTLVKATLNSDEKPVKISEDTITTTWYDPAFITVDRKNYVFYSDTSTTGVSYIKYVDVDGEIETVYKDEEETEIDYRKLNGQIFLGQMTEADVVKVVENKISLISASSIKMEENDSGKLESKVVKEARDAYEALSKEAKEGFSSETYKVLEQGEDAIALANAYKKLSKVDEYADLGTSEKDTFKADYETAKALRNEIVQKGETYYSSVRDMIENNYKYFYQEAGKILDK